MLKQFVQSVLCVLFVILTFPMMMPSASAQLQPRLSPWLHMAERQTSPLGNYHALVRPHQELLRTQQIQTQQIQAQQRALLAMQSAAALSGGSMGSRDLAAGSGAAGGASTAREVLSPPREIPRANQNPAGFNQHLHYPPGSLPRRPVPNFSATGRR